MRLNQAVSARSTELLKEKGMTQYRLFLKNGVSKSTIDSVKL